MFEFKVAAYAVFRIIVELQGRTEHGSYREVLDVVVLVTSGIPLDKVTS